MLPLGMDAVYNWITIGAGLINVVLACIWARKWQQTGMAWAVVITEYSVMFAIWTVLRVNKADPFSDRDVWASGSQSNSLPSTTSKSKTMRSQIHTDIPVELTPGCTIQAHVCYRLHLRPFLGRALGKRTATNVPLG